MSFAEEKRQIRVPPRSFTAVLVAISLMSALACIFLDQARGAAYFTVPVLAFLFWCTEAQITYMKTRNIKICVWALCLVYWFTGNAFLMQVISVEAGDPIIKTGPIYEVSAFMAKQPKK